MIGLRTGEVLLSYDHEAAVFDYAETRRKLKGVLPAGVHVEHIGSTAVRGLIAKPIVDIVIGLADFTEFDLVVERMKAKGYRYRGFRPNAGGHICDFLVGERTTRHAHIVVANSEQWHRYIVFRDFLTSCPSARNRYEAIKRALALQYPWHRRAYTASKHEFIEALTDEAIASRSVRV